MKQEFTSIVKLLKEAGHKYIEIKSEPQISWALFDAPGEMTWFYKLNIIVNNNNNECLQFKFHDGKWLKRKNKMNGWYAIPSLREEFYNAMKEYHRTRISALIEEEL